jgi:hypothetical protein
LDDRKSEAEAGAGCPIISVEHDGGTRPRPDARVIDEAETEIEAAATGKTHERQIPVIVAGAQVYAALARTVGRLESRDGEVLCRGRLRDSRGRLWQSFDVEEEAERAAS